AVGLALLAPVRAQESSPAALDAARRHVAARAQVLGATAADVADMAVTASHADPRAGLTYVYLRQRIDGVEVAGSEVTVAVRSDGAVAHAAGTLIALLDRAGRAAPTLSAESAVRAAAAQVGAALPPVLAAGAPRGADRLTAFDTPADALAPLTARLVYHAAGAAAPVLAWEVGPLETAGAEPHAWMVRVDAATGAERWRADLVAFDPMPHPEGSATEEPVSLAPLRAQSKNDGPLAVRLPDQYRVFPPPAEGPNETASVLIANPADLLASPFGWHDTDGLAGAEFTITRGNNTHAYIDANADNLPDAGLDVDGGATLSFDFPADLTQHPNTYRPAAVTNLFYWSNIIHDILYQYGFTEAAGNFQVNNYGRGGVGNDDLRSEGQDGAGTNNANFSTPADGQRPRMQMFLYTLTTPFRDGDLSNMTLVHEYSHGLTNRLTGGPTVTGCLSNGEQMGEGWGDWLAAMLTMVETDTRTTHRPYGVYPRGLDPAGPGLRLAALDTDFAFNNYTYARTRTMGTTSPHNIGFVWSTVLWEVAWEMIDAYGFHPDFYDADGTAGNQMMIRLMVQGLKLQPCSPGFVTGRDAILAADALLYPDPSNPGRGLHYASLWTGFARRGLGFSASQGSSAINTDNTEAFDFPFPAAAAAFSAEALSAAVATDAATTRTLIIENTAALGSAHLTYVVTPQAAPLGVAAGGDETPAGPPVSGTLEVLGAPAPDATPGVPWITASALSGSVPPGEADTLVVTLDADGLADGLYTAALRVVTTDPTRPTTTVPVTLQVGGA
ncbi:MAG TPA: extracellular metalloproteinase, partial [Rhodothermales bacterium]|nr:extracellular metalloproteinase [Rhodothermales bacterium]